MRFHKSENTRFSCSEGVVHWNLLLVNKETEHFFHLIAWSRFPQWNRRMMQNRITSFLKDQLAFFFFCTLYWSVKICRSVLAPGTGVGSIVACDPLKLGLCCLQELNLRPFACKAWSCFVKQRWIFGGNICRHDLQRRIFFCTWVNQLGRHLLEAADLLFLRRMNDHGGGAQDAEQTAKLPVQV